MEDLETWTMIRIVPSSGAKPLLRAHGTFALHMLIAQSMVERRIYLGSDVGSKGFD